MEQSVSNKLLLRFLKKETSEEENEMILTWISCSEENREEFRQIHRAFHLSGTRQFEAGVDIEAAWEKLFSRVSAITKQDLSVDTLVERKPGSGRRQQGEQRKQRDLGSANNVIWKVAASVAIMLSIGFGSLWGLQHFSNQSGTANIRIESPAGEKSKVVLVDGTQVWLNSQTILNYNASEPRSVKLEGEAYFDVAKDRKHPFEVMTASGLKVTVLGTKFNLRSFANENRVETTLEEGEVIITGVDAERPVRLEPGQQAGFDIRNKQFHIKNVSPDIYSVWKNNELRFTDTSFRDLVPRIERWYGINVDLDPAISITDRFTMTIKTESLRELLTMMQLTSKFDYEISGEEVTISNK
ncbi:MAG: FecR domain-containing protein [Prolixibacteraceae bacterium]